ncbi:MAG: mannose-6-phosphate isomerase [Gammaproteobacteria bacterium RIFCSPHIGHO2_12_FULL_35_23]|nr:MAG: mannose-6-phosphate isomerase [Gammaproteobacteria bacterium RIFCSPHIGHO2_12_FULL_35_23]
MQKVNLQEKLNLFNEYWAPKIVGNINGSQVKLAKLKGEFVWHKHDNEDEMFFIIKGKLLIKFKDHNLSLQEGEFLIIPKGVEHMPVAEEEVHVMLIEPKTTLHTGDIKCDLTKNNQERI